jgi:hypothetical protein
VYRWPPTTRETLLWALARWWWVPKESEGTDAFSDDAAGATGFDLADAIDGAIAVRATSIARVGAGEGDGEATAALFDGGTAAVALVFAIAILVAGHSDTMTEGAVKGARLGAEEASATVGICVTIIDPADVVRHWRDPNTEGLGLLAIKADTHLAVDSRAALIGAADLVLAEERLFKDLFTDTKPIGRDLYTRRPWAVRARVAIA